jgi:enoyl-CoA hydratase/carnithine racemase
MPDLIYEKNAEGHYAVFTMNRPERLNALGGDMGRELDEALRDFSADDSMFAGIVTGNGRAFCAGADLKAMTERNARAAEIRAKVESGELSKEEGALQLAPAGGGAGGGLGVFSTTSKPIIAAVNGLAIGGGCERSMDCDIRIASTEAYFGLYEVQRGIMAGFAVHHGARVMPFGELSYLLYTAKPLSAQEAYRIGFVHEVVEPDQLLPKAIEIARDIGKNAPLAVQGSKAIVQFWRQFAMTQSQQLGANVGRWVLNSEDAKEGPRAFAEKRAPNWLGR